MKKCYKSDRNNEGDNIQEKITDFTDDLMTVLDAHMDDLEIEELFYTAIKFMTFAMYECLKDHKLSLKTLKLAMDHGIEMHLNKKDS